MLSEAMRASVPAVIVMVVACAVSSYAQRQASAPPKWKQEFQRARQVWDNGESDRALRILEKTLVLAPDNTARAQIAFRYADWSHQLGRYSTARQWYQKCLDVAPEGSDLIRRATAGLKSLPPPAPAPALPGTVPPVAVTPPHWRQVREPAPERGPVYAAAVVMLVMLFGFLLVLRWASGWRKEAFFAQVLLSALLAGAGTMMLPLAWLALVQELNIQPDGWMAGALTLGSVGCLAFAARSWQQGQLLRSTPLTRLRSASHGFLKVRGVAEPAFGLLNSRVGDIPALYLHEVSERYVRRTESYYDSQSKRWKTRTVYRWETIYSFVQGVNFIMDDGTGKAIVEVQGAEFHPQHVALFYNYTPVRSFPWFASVGDVRTRVSYIPPNATVTVWARYYEHDLPGTTRDEMRLQYDRFHRCMVVLEGQESKVYSSRTGTGLALAVMGVLMALGVLFILLNPGIVATFAE